MEEEELREKNKPNEPKKLFCPPPRLNVTKPGFEHHAESLVERPLLKAEAKERVDWLLKKYRDDRLSELLHGSVQLHRETNEE